MILKMPDFGDDDPGFLTSVDQVIRGVVGTFKPPQFQVFRINNYFGLKWLGFCGKLVGALGCRNFTNVVIPPFVQNRLTARSYFVRNANESYEYLGEGLQIHHVGKSSDNFRNFAATNAPETDLFWFSGNTLKNKRGSLMGYSPGKSYWLWYLEFHKKGDRWSISKQHDLPLSIIEIMKSQAVSIDE